MLKTRRLSDRLTAMRKLSKNDLDELILQMIRQREKLEPKMQEYWDEVVPIVKDYAKEYKQYAEEYKDKAVEEYQSRILPKIKKQEKVMLTLFYLYTMTSNYKLSEKRAEWKAKIGKMVR